MITNGDRMEAEYRDAPIFITDKKIKDKTLELLLTDISQDRLPNILFDITFKKSEEPLDQIKRLIQEVGYSPQDVNFLWVLSDYKIAVLMNKKRDRIVPDDVLLQTHEGAAVNFMRLVRSEIPELTNKYIFDGTIKVVLNFSDIRYEVSPYTKVKTDKRGEPAKGIIKDFKYLTLKERGKPITTDKEIHDELMSWVLQNIPKTDKTKFFWPDA